MESAELMLYREGDWRIGPHGAHYIRPGDYADYSGDLFAHKITNEWYMENTNLGDSEMAEANWSHFQSNYDVAESEVIRYEATSGERTFAWYTFSLTDVVQEYVSSPESNNGFIIRAESDGYESDLGPNRGGMLGKYTRHNSVNIETRPKLVITYRSDETDINTTNVSTYSTNMELSRTCYNRLMISNLNDGGYQVNIFSLSGRSILSTQSIVSGNQMIVDFDRQGLNQGVFIVNVSSSNGETYSDKIVW